MKLTSLKIATITTAAVLAAGGIASAATASASHEARHVTFHLVRSAGSVSAGCLTKATATVDVKHEGQVEIMTIDAAHLPKNTGFDVFILQLPNAPFGVAWYQGDLHSNSHGKAHGEYAGRFSDESFAVAPGSGPAPVVHTGDASTNPAFAPIHTFHVGVWFNSAKASAKAGCANVVTPFNGEHNAGPQALSTQQFADANGPLRSVKS